MNTIRCKREGGYYYVYPPYYSGILRYKSPGLSGRWDKPQKAWYYPVDRESEVVQLLQDAYPGYGILVEQYPQENSPPEETAEVIQPKEMEETEMAKNKKRYEEPKVETAPVSVGGSIEDIIWKNFQPRISEYVNGIKAELAPQLKQINLTVNKEDFAKFDGTSHAQLGTVVSRVAVGLKNILLVGPAGCGKTHLASDLAKSLGRSFTSISCTAGMPEWHLVGRATPNLTTGDQVYQSSAFVDAYESGGVVLLDELDAADPNTLLVVNAALANGHLDLPARAANRIARRHDDFVLICAANTFGNGASRQYVGRNQLDASTLSRFAGAVIAMDYDQTLEKSLVPDEDLRHVVWGIRVKIQNVGLRRVMGTRELLAAHRLHKGLDMSVQDSIKALLVGWTEDELQKVM